MAERQPQTGNNTAAIIFAVFAVVCVVAFLANRGNDVGQLPTLVGNLGGGPLVGNGSVDTLVGILAAVLILASWAGLGGAILKILPNTDNDRLQLVTRIAVGAAGWSLVWFFLGLVGGYHGWIALVTSAVGLILFFAFKGWRTHKSEARDNLSVTLLLMVAIVLLLAAFAAIAPPIAKDTLLYHFSVPKGFIAQHSNAFIDGNIASYLALGTEMHSVWAMLLGELVSARSGEVAAGMVGFFFFAVLLTTISHWGAELNLSRSWALTAMAMVATVPTAYHVASSGYIDLSLALYVTLATYALTRWWKEQTWGWVILIGIFLGAALSIKLTTVFVIAAFALVVLFRARKNPVAIAPGSDTLFWSSSGRIFVTGIAALLLAGAIASPWYIRTWAATGSPVFPFYMSIWPGKANGWDVERSNLFQAMNSQYGGADINKLNYLTAPATQFRSWLSQNSQQITTAFLA